MIIRSNGLPRPTSAPAEVVNTPITGRTMRPGRHAASAAARSEAITAAKTCAEPTSSKTRRIRSPTTSTRALVNGPASAGSTKAIPIMSPPATAIGMFAPLKGSRKVSIDGDYPLTDPGDTGP